jgi:hypothetical protein
MGRCAAAAEPAGTAKDGVRHRRNALQQPEEGATAEPEDAIAETRRIFGDSVMASGGGGKGSGSIRTWAALPPPSERGLWAMFSSPTAALAELRDINAQYAALRKLAYAIQGMAPEQLSAEWDTLRATGNDKYDELERAIQLFTRHSNGAPRWRPRFYTYYILPILLNLIKLAIFCSPAGILGVLLYDVAVIAAFTVLRHPYAVSVAVSYAGDHAAIPSMAKTACLYLAYEALKSAAQEQGVTLVETWDEWRLDLRPFYTAALWLYLVYTVAHQGYTLYVESSWKHRRLIDVFLSVAAHQVNNLSFVVATCECGVHLQSPARSDAASSEPELHSHPICVLRRSLLRARVNPLSDLRGEPVLQVHPRRRSDPAKLLHVAPNAALQRPLSVRECDESAAKCISRSAV